MNSTLGKMRSDIIAEMEEVKTIALPKGDNAGMWSDYETGRKDITISLGNFNIAKLSTGRAYSQLRALFQIDDFLSVAKFISRNPSVYNALLEIEEAIRVYFSEEKLHLTLYEDPEGEMDDELAIYILTRDEPHTALDKLNQFDCNYWIEKIDQYENFITVNIEYL